MKSLDGLRAIAILLILLAENNVIDLGWTGIELAFVLTGFLMTKILRGSRESKSYWSSFYLKRAVRFVPLLLLLLAINKLAVRNLPVVGLAGYGLFLGDVMNVTRYAWSGLGVLWSIAVGAHFLLFWSVAVRFLNRHALVGIAVAILLIEPALRHFYTPYSVGFEPIYNLTIFRLDSLAAGGLLALLAEEPAPSRFLERWSGWAALVILAGFLIVSYLYYPWFVRSFNTVIYNTTAYSTLTIMYFCFVARVVFLKESSVGYRILAWAPLQFIGRISYGLYLFHPLVYTTLKKLLHLPFGVPGEHANRQIFPVAFLISVLLATFLHRFIEAPAIAWGRKKAKDIQERCGDPPRTEQDAIAAPA